MFYTKVCGYLLPNWHFLFCPHHSHAPGIALMTPYLTVRLHLTCTLGSKVSFKLVLDAKSLCHQIISNMAVPNDIPINSVSAERVPKLQNFDHLFIYVPTFRTEQERS